MSDKIKWGIIGSGGISKQFAEGLAVLEDAEISAIASRSIGSAEKFAEEFNIPNAFGSYQGMAEKSDVDVIYIATPHPTHMDNTLLCLNNGRNVLCEKPFAMNEEQVECMIKKAEEKDLFLMEALWMAFFPAIAKMRKLISSGEIGELRFLQANICFDCGWDPESNLLNKKNGGGTLLGLGVYAISFAQLIFGEPPLEIATLPFIGKTGVDEHASIIFKYPGNKTAIVNSGIQVEMPQDAIIAGKKGLIKVPQFFWNPDEFILCKDKEEEVVPFSRLGNGYSYEAIEVMNCIKEGKKQSDLISWDFSLNTIRTMDRVREMWGLEYPDERHLTKIQSF
ncbi:MAG: Gfo/Idh/MocA family protein [Planctomycetota bacterium]|jgi:predicted dehydrogenase